MALKRPGWWPRPWPWPGPGGEPGDPPGPGLPPAARRRTGTAEDPAATFLRTLSTAFGAERTVLYRLDRDREAWVPERWSAGDRGPSAPPDETAAAGHPLSWCLREELVAQIPREEMAGDRRGAGWALAGPVPGSDRMLVMAFGGSPPAGARRAVDAARRHVAALEARGVLDAGPGGGDA